MENARVLALHLAHYRAAHGEIPLKKAFDLLLTETLNDEQVGELADGFGVLIEVIRAVATPVGRTKDGEFGVTLDGCGHYEVPDVSDRAERNPVELGGGVSPLCAGEVPETLEKCR